MLPTKCEKSTSLVPHLNEEDEFVITSKIMSNDIQEIQEGLATLISKGAVTGPFRRLYEAAQAKILANMEFEKAKAEILKQIKSAKVSPRKTNTLSTAGTVCGNEFPRSESLLKDSRRKNAGIGKKDEPGVADQRKRTMSIMK